MPFRLMLKRISLPLTSLCLTLLLLGSCSAGGVTSSPSPSTSPSPSASAPETPTTSPSASIPAESPSPEPSATATPTGIVYHNTDYGFDFYLPDAWAGYTIVTEEWKGTPLTDSQQAGPSGPKLLIRNPKWTEDVPMQDIPIMVFTIDQWDALQREEFSVSAAPIGPTELGRNSTYVFALPARYNFAFLPGWEEVEDILNAKPLSAYDI